MLAARYSESFARVKQRLPPTGQGPSRIQAWVALSVGLQERHGLFETGLEMSRWQARIHMVQKAIPEAAMHRHDGQAVLIRRVEEVCRLVIST